MAKRKKVLKQVDRNVLFGDMDLTETGVAVCYTCGYKVKYREWDKKVCPKCSNRLVVEW